MLMGDVIILMNPKHEPHTFDLWYGVVRQIFNFELLKIFGHYFIIFPKTVWRK